MALALFGTAALGAAELLPDERAEAPLGVLVLGQSDAEAVRVVAAADGRLVAYGGWLGIAVAVSNDPEFAAKLKRAGATLVFRADGAVGCAGVAQTTRRT